MLSTYFQVPSSLPQKEMVQNIRIKQKLHSSNHQVVSQLQEHYEKSACIIIHLQVALKLEKFMT